MKRPGANLATITRSRPNLVSVSGPGQARQSLYDVVTPGEAEEDNLLGHNIYDATPDHSILKHGLAKSLSNFHIGEFSCSDNPPLIWRPQDLFWLNLTLDLNS